MTNDKVTVSLDEAADTLYMIIPENPDRFDDVEIDTDSGCGPCCIVNPCGSGSD